MTNSEPIKPNNPDRRFAGVSKVYGAPALNRFQAAHIGIIGLGGVGSWVVEGLVRSGIGSLTLIDLDHVTESNINRQLQATEDTLGMAKTSALAARIKSINPSCTVNEIETFIDPENQAELLEQGYDWVIDCIDNFRTKAALIYYCRRNKIKLLTIGGAGGMIDPAKITIADLSKSRHDPLLSQTRRLLRQNYRFPTNLSRSFQIPCIYSPEPLIYPDDQGKITSKKPQGSVNSGLNCAGGFGSAVAVTASFGFAASAYVLKKLSNQV